MLRCNDHPYNRNIYSYADITTLGIFLTILGDLRAGPLTQSKSRISECRKIAHSYNKVVETLFNGFDRILIDVIKPSLRCRGVTTPEPPEDRLTSNQGRGRMNNCSLTNQGRYKFTFRIGAKRAQNPANQISVNHSLDQSHEGLQGGYTGLVLGIGCRPDPVQQLGAVAKLRGIPGVLGGFRGWFWSILGVF
jgi:hypothetical protein